MPYTTSVTRLVVRKKPDGRSALRWKLILLAVVVVVAGVVHLLLAPRPDPLDRFPHAFIAEAGYDPALVVVLYAPLSQPPPPPDGMAPAWSCAAPPFADGQDRPWLFPLAGDGHSAPVPPVHPVVKAAPPLSACRRLQTEEGERLLAAFRDGLPH